MIRSISIRTLIMKATPQTAIQLYKYLLRQVYRLPEESQSYYRNYIKGVRHQSTHFFVVDSYLFLSRIFVRMLTKPILNVSTKS
jgi:hypothetical protein